MSKNNLSPTVSIIIVHYNVKKELFACLNSIYASKPHTSFEIIVVDNDEKKNIKKDLLKQFPEVIYLENNNTGWGGGINAGIPAARGEYLYLLNPDTEVEMKTIDLVVQFAREHQDSGIVASLLTDQNHNPYVLQGSQELTPGKAIIVYSFLDELFPNNRVSSRFFYKDSNRSIPFQVEIATLTAALIRTKLFKKVGMFDEKYFLYFEEYDLGRRVNKLGLKNYILSDSRVMHIWGASTKKTSQPSQYLLKSRDYYFRKHFGSLSAFLVRTFLAIHR